MSKKIKALIFGGIAVVVLAAITVILVVTAPSNNEESSFISTNAIPLIDELSTDVDSLYVKNATGEYTIETIGEDLWRIKDISDFKSLDYLYQQTLSNLCTFSATELIEENCSDLERYGLSDPYISFVMKFTNGNSYSFHIGAKTADGSNYYLIKDGETDVYLITATSISNLLLSKYSYLDKEVLASFDEEDSESVPHINSVRISRPDLPYEIVIEEVKDGELGENAASQSYLVMREPQYARLDESKLQTLIFGNFGMTAADVVKANITSEDLTEYGFDQPTAVYEMTYDNNTTVKFTLGAGFNSADGYQKGQKVSASKIDSYYLIREDVDQIYVISASSIEWQDVQPKDFISSTVVMPNILDIDGFDVTVKGTTNKIVLTPGEDKDDSSTYTATLNGASIDMDQCRSYLQLLMITNATDIYTGEIKGTEQMSIVYHYKNGTTATVRFYVDEENTTYITVNDTGKFIGRVGLINKVASETEKLKNGETVDIDW